MIELPRLKNYKKKTKKYLFSFGGINKTENFVPGELEISKNVGFECFPQISARKGREVYLKEISSDLHLAGGLVRVSDNSATEKYIYRLPEGGSSWIMSVGFSSAEKEIVEAGGKIVVFPDKKYVDASSYTTNFSPIEASISYSHQTIYISDSKIKFKTEEQFNTFKNTFKAGDVINFTGGYYIGNQGKMFSGEKKIILRALEKERGDVTTSYYAVFDPWTFDLEGTVSGYFYDNYYGIFEKKVPNLKLLCSWGGRLWGVDENKNICASKYMDPTNFEYFDMSAADSFTLEMDTMGDFTGVCAFGDHIAFFKENRIHRITGTKPSNFRHTVLEGRGVKKGAKRSVTVIDSVAYYEGVDGIYAYNGGEPRKISQNLGALSHHNGVGTVLGKIYYLSFKSDDKYVLYAYDTEKGVWLREGDTKFKAAVNFEGTLFYLDENGEIIKIKNEPDTEEDYSVTLREITENFSEQKGFSRLYLGYKMRRGGKIKVEVCYDNKDKFETVSVLTNNNKTVSEIRFKPNRSDFVKIRLTATPDVIIKSLMRETFEYGSLF